MIHRLIRYIGIIILAVIATLCAVPSAATVLIGGFGLWSDFAVDSPHSTPGGLFQFAFALPDILPPDSDPGIGYDTTAATGFQFQLDGIDVLEPLLSVTFYTYDDGGLFDLHFASGTLNLYGYDDIGSGGKVGRSGIYGAAIGIDDVEDFDGFAAVLAYVPEPATWALLIGGFAMTGIALRGRRHLTA